MWGGGNGGNVTSAGWQLTLSDHTWRVNSRRDETTLRNAVGLLRLLCFAVVYRCRRWLFIGAGVRGTSVWWSRYRVGRTYA